MLTQSEKMRRFKSLVDDTVHKAIALQMPEYNLIGIGSIDMMLLQLQTMQQQLSSMIKDCSEKEQRKSKGM